MDDDRHFLVETGMILAAVSAGLGMLVLLFAWLVLADDVDAASASVGRGGVLGPYLWMRTSMFSAVGSFFLGWFSGWVVERRNLFTWWMPMAMGAVSIGGGLGLFAATSGASWSMAPFIILCTAAFSFGGLIRWRSES